MESAEPTMMATGTPSLSIYVTNSGLEARGQALARELSVPYRGLFPNGGLAAADDPTPSCYRDDAVAATSPSWPGRDKEGEATVALRLGDDGLALTDGSMEMRGDLARMGARIKPGRLAGELLVKAAKLKNAGDAPLAVDATAGLGEDSLLLAAAGFRVVMFERDPVIAALLEDSLKRAADDPALTAIVARMDLRKGDSIDALASLPERPDVVLLDPMFPGRQKSAAVKKKFQLLHHLERPCTDERELLDAAVAAQPRKIVIKRPPKGPYLAGVKPAYSLTGKAVRFDVIAIAR